MTAVQETQQESSISEAVPGLLGLSHLGFTVSDMPAAQRFWTQVMGFRTLVDGDEFCMLFEPSAKLAIGFTTNQGQAAGPFDEWHVGLDHLGLAVADLDTLIAWERRLTEFDVPHAPITQSDAGHHLNLRGPENFPVELFVLTPQGAAELGLPTGTPPVAETHQTNS